MILTRPLDPVIIFRPVGNRVWMRVIKVVEVYHFRVVVPAGYEADLLHSIEKIVPPTYGNYDRITWVSSPGMEQYRVLPGVEPASQDDKNVIATEDDLVKAKCVRDTKTPRRSRHLKAAWLAQAYRGSAKLLFL